MFKRKKKETIKKFFPSLPMEVKGLEQFLEEMSENGYLLVGNSSAFYTFEECEPKTRRFHVEYFTKASIFDSKPEKKTRELIDYCEVAGWKHCFSNGKMQCFYTEDMDVMEVETEPELRFKSITKAAISSQIVVWLLTVFYIYMGVNYAHVLMNSPYLFSGFLSSRIAMGLFFFWCIFIVQAINSFAEVVRFYYKNKKNISIGEQILLYNSARVKKKMKHRFISLAVMFLGLMLVIFDEIQLVFVLCFMVVFMLIILIAQGKFMKSKFSNRGTNIALTIVMTFVAIQILTIVVIGSVFIGNSVVYDNNSISFYKEDEIPLSLDDLGIFPSSDYLYRDRDMKVNGTLFANETVFSDHFIPSDGYTTDSRDTDEFPFLKVKIFKSKFQLFMDKYVDIWLNHSEEKGNRVLENRFLGYDVYACEVVDSENYWFLFVNEEQTVEIICSQKLSEDQLTYVVLNSDVKSKAD